MTDPRIKVSRKQEKQVATTFGARQHAGSGSGHRKYDMHSDDELVECKTVLSSNKQITLKSDYLKSFSYQAALQGKRPVLHIRLDSKDYVLLHEDDYLELTNDGEK